MKSDMQLKNDVTDALRWDPTITFKDITVAAVDGVVTLSGSVPYYAEKRSAERVAQHVAGVKAIAEELQVSVFGAHLHHDTEIAQTVVNALRWHVWVPNTIQATVENGWISLSGTVTWEFQRNAAVDAVRYLSGVKGVSNGITLAPTVQPSAVQDAIEKALVRDAAIDAKRITVSATGGTVTLSGSIPSLRERNGAGWAAWSAPGVTMVSNDLVVAN